MLEFKVLKDLVKIINLNKIKHIELLDTGNEEKRIQKLYMGLLRDKYDSDEDASLDLFGRTPDYQSYGRLRRKLLDQLVNTSFFVDVEQAKYNEGNRAYYMCYRHLSSAAILLSLGAANAAIHVLRNALEHSVKYEMTGITTEILSLLRRAYIQNQIAPKEIKRFTQMSNRYEEKRYYEYKASVIFEDLIEGYSSGRVRKEMINETVKNEFEMLLGVAEEVDTTRFYFIIYNIGIIYFISHYDMRKVVELCENAIDILQKRQNAKRAEILQFAINALACYTQLKKFNTDQVNKLMQLCAGLSIAGNANWAKINEAIVHHYIYAERYTEALDLHEQVVNHPRFKLFPPAVTEIWKVYAGYFHLLAVLRVIDDELVFKKVGPIDIDRFEMEIKSLSQVKIGMNIPVLMLPVWFKSLEGNMDAHGRSKDSLRQYAHRHLKKSKNVRTVAMLNLLMALDKYAYEPKSAKRLIAKHLKTLTDMPIELSQQSSAIEIVPYEKLWELILRYKRVSL